MVLHRVVPVYADVQVLLEKEKVKTGERKVEQIQADMTTEKL